MAIRRSGEREAFWRERVREQAESGLSVRRFCQTRGLSEASFYAWRRTLQERDRAAAPAFVPVTMIPTVVPAAGVSAGGGEIVLELRGGRRMRLPETMPPQRVAVLIHALEASEAAR